MKYPNYNNIAHLAKTSGGNPPDPISGTTVFDAIYWDAEDGKIWKSSVLASDIDNTIIWRKTIFQIALVGTKITADEIISRIASYTCPSLQGETPRCTANEYGIPQCHRLPLCKHARTVKAEIMEKGE